MMNEIIHGNKIDNRNNEHDKNINFWCYAEYRRGCFVTLLDLKNTLEHFKKSAHSKLIPKKVYKLIESYLSESLHNIDEFLNYGGLLNVIIDKDNCCKRVSDEQAKEFIVRNQQ